ncbi:MAG: helix-turn-helix transcriptional regulator [Holosporales bacterium]
MRKIDRLFEIIQLLRGQRLRTAAMISEKLGVSVRTVYRDIQGLMAAGVPIEGEPGMGYVIRQPLELPPLHFTPLELRAIQLGISMVKAVADDEVSACAQEVAIKLRDVLPSSLWDNNYSPAGYVYFSSDGKTKEFLKKMRHAIDNNKKISFFYGDEHGHQTSRTVRPLGLEYWGKVWTLTAWCELRNDFRVFRLDRLQSLALLQECFASEKGKTYRDYLSRCIENND